MAKGQTTCARWVEEACACGVEGKEAQIGQLLEHDVNWEAKADGVNS